MKHSVRIALLVLSVILLGAFVVFVEIPERTRFWFEVFTAGHTVVFGLCALAGLVLSQTWFARRPWPRLAHYLNAFLIATIVGAATELIQPYVGRDGELADLYRDMLGAVAFLFTAMTLDRTLRWDFRLGQALRRVVWLLSLLMILLIFWPAMKWGGAYIYRDSRMPVVMDFQSRVMQLFTRVANGRLDVVVPPVNWVGAEAKVGQLTLLAGPYPGMTLRELSPVWSGYSALVFDLYSPRTDTIELEFRVNDRSHNEKYNDRFNAVLKIVPGVNHFRFELDRVTKTGSGRLMDLSDMGTIVLFVHRPADSIQVLLSSFRLE